MQTTSQNPHELGDIFIFAVKLKLSPPHHGTCLNKGFHFILILFNFIFSVSVGTVLVFTVQEFYFMQIASQNLLDIGYIFYFAIK